MALFSLEASFLFFALRWSTNMILIKNETLFRNLLSSVVCRASYLNNYVFDFSEITGQILMKLGQNDHLVVGIRIYTWKGSDPTGGWGRDQMGSNSAKSSNDFFSETTGHILMKLGHNDHLDMNYISLKSTPYIHSAMYNGFPNTNVQL